MIGRAASYPDKERGSRPRGKGREPKLHSRLLEVGVAAGTALETNIYTYVRAHTYTHTLSI